MIFLQDYTITLTKKWWVFTNYKKTKGKRSEGIKLRKARLPYGWR